MLPKFGSTWRRLFVYVKFISLLYSVLRVISSLTAMKLSFILSILSYWATKPGELLLKSTGVRRSMVGSHSINPPVFILISSCQNRIRQFFSIGKVLMCEFSEFFKSTSTSCKQYSNLSFLFYLKRPAVAKQTKSVVFILKSSSLGFYSWCMQVRRFSCFIFLYKSRTEEY